MREQDALLAKWAGFDEHECDEWAFHCDDCQRGSPELRHYTTSDQDAVLLLPVLVENGYQPALVCLIDNSWCCTILKNRGYVLDKIAPTIAAAICNAILSLPEVQAMKEE